MELHLGLAHAHRRGADIGLHQLAVIAHAQRHAGAVLGIGLDQRRGLLRDNGLRLDRGIGAKARQARSRGPAGIDHHRFGPRAHAAAGKAGGHFGRAAQVAQLRQPGLPLRSR
jgi:hypothetical protein